MPNSPAPSRTATPMSAMATGMGLHLPPRAAAICAAAVLRSPGFLRWLDSAVTNDTRGSVGGPAAIAASKRRSTVEREFDLDQLHRPPKKIGPAERCQAAC